MPRSLRNGIIRRTPPKNLGLLELIRAKREWDWKPSVAELKAGFRGWHQRGFLPHFAAPGVSFRRFCWKLLDAIIGCNPAVPPRRPAT
jgi:hypothetical protein